MLHPDNGSPAAAWGLRTFTFMEKFPLLSLAPTAAPFEYKGAFQGMRFFMRVACDAAAVGRATVADFGPLVLAASKLEFRLNEGLPLVHTIAFRPREVLRRLGRATGGHQLKQLEESCRRLQATSVATDFRLDGARSKCSFHLLESFTRPGRDERAFWTITVPDWLLLHVKYRQILQIDGELLKLQGLSRRIAGWCRSHAGGAGYEAWRIPLDEAYFKSGATDAPRKFRYALRSLLAKEHIRGFRLNVEAVSGREFLVVYRTGPPAGDELADPDVLTIDLGGAVEEASGQALEIISVSLLDR